MKQNPKQLSEVAGAQPTSTPPEEPPSKGKGGGKEKGGKGQDTSWKKATRDDRNIGKNANAHHGWENYSGKTSDTPTAAAEPKASEGGPGFGGPGSIDPWAQAASASSSKPAACKSAPLAPPVPVGSTKPAPDLD